MRFLTSLAVTAVVSAVAFAADPIGTASSSTAFGLNGVSMRSDGVSSWPVMSGDEISSGGAPVMIRFQDGSRVTLGEQSRAKLTDTGNGLTLNVTAGEAQFNLAQPSGIRILNQGRAVGTRSGTISRNPSVQGGQNATVHPNFRQPPPPMSTP